MLKEIDFQNILSKVRYPGFDFVLKYEIDEWPTTRPMYPYLQIECKGTCKGTCNVTGESMNWKSRKWKLSEHMVPSEVVQTAFKAVLTAIEHEAREKFSYKGVSVFDAHIDVEKLVELRSSDECLSRRD